MMASPTEENPASLLDAGKSDNKQLVVTSYGGNTATVDNATLNKANIYEGITLSMSADVPPPAEQLQDLVIVVNANDSLSLTKETMEAINGSAGPLTGPKMFRKHPESESLGEELSPLESSKYITKLPHGMANPHIITPEITDLFNMNPEEMERLESALLSEQTSQTEVAPLISTPAIEGTAEELPKSHIKTPDSSQNITEEMLDEKFRQELLDKDDYAHFSGKSSDNISDSDSDMKIVLSPKKGMKPKLRKSPLRNRKPMKGKQETVVNPQNIATVDVDIMPTVTETKPVKGADLKPKEAMPLMPIKKTYPKRENRRLPDRLKDSAEPGLFSIPDVMNRLGVEKNIYSGQSVTVETLEHALMTSQTLVYGEEKMPPVKRTFADQQQEDCQKDEEVLQNELLLRQQVTNRGLGKAGTDDSNAAEPNDLALENQVEVKVSKRIRKRKVSFGEMEDVKPKPRAKPKQKPKGKGAQGNRLKPNPAQNDDNTDEGDGYGSSDDASVNSEDDPNRLWCICKKPHNNRFMICCDMCEDWFHGHCVGVTKAMGKAMEDKGRDWTCPACKKKKAEKIPLAGRVPGKEVPSKIPANRTSEKSDETTSKAPKRRMSSTVGGESLGGFGIPKIPKVNDHTEANQPVAESESSQENITYCIVCKMQARSNSIYCSDNCILKHASTSKPVTKSDSLNSAVSSNTLRPNHPAFKVGGETKVGPKVDPHSKSVRLVKIASIPPAGSSSHTVKKPSITATKISQQSISRSTEAFYPKAKHTVVIKPKQITMTSVSSSKPIPKKRINVSGSSAPSDSKTMTKAVGSKSNKEKIKSKRVDSKRLSSGDRKSSEMLSPDAEKGAHINPEPIRITVRDTLHGLLLARLQECEDELKDILDEDVKKIGYDIEEELYSYFKEAGSKYKSKYRSLVFNIRDPTNLTLFRKIADKSVTPHQLVRLSPEELASQQLAQWRERESKHQIEMIKKNELDLLGLSKSVVMKTHKGEHIIDSSDIRNQTVLGFDIDHPENFTHSSVTSTVSDGSSENREKSKLYSKQKSSSRSSSKHKSKSRSRDEKKDDRGRDRSRHKKSSRRRDSDHRKLSAIKLSTSSSKALAEKEKSEILAIVKDDFEEVMNPAIETSTMVPSEQSTYKPTELQIKEEAIKLEDINADREPTSTVPDVSNEPSTFEKSYFIATEWTGFVSMQDVAKFSTSIQVISGAPLTTCKDLPPTIDIIGRIDPDTVWQYISKMKRSGTKEIIVVRLNAENDEEMVRYMLLYTYLNSRNRLGVVGSLPKSIKDFYVLPLSSANPLPQVLLPLDGPGFVDSRPHLLLGVIVRPRRKRQFISKVMRAESSMRSYTPPPSGDRSLTPPINSLFGGNPAYKNLRKESKKAKVAYENKKKELIPDPEDGDEPYSPGDSDASDLDDMLSAPQSELKRRMDLINRQIAEQKQEIKNISSAIVGDQPADESNHDSNEAYSPSASFTPPHRTSFPFMETTKPGGLPNIPTDISLPANIQEILASIKKQSDARLDIKMDPIVQNYGSKKDDKKNSKPTVVSYTPTTIKSTKAAEIKLPTPVKSRDPRTQEVPKPSSTLSKLTDAELIEKAAMEMGAEQPMPSDIHSYSMPPPPGVDSVSPAASFVAYPPGQHNYAMNPASNFLPPPIHGTQMPLQMPLPMPPPGMNPNVPPPGYPGGSFGMQFPGPNFLGPPPPNVGFNQPYSGPPHQQPPGHFVRHQDVGRGERGGMNRFRGRGDSNQRRGRSRWNQRDASPRGSSRPRRDSSDRSHSSRDSKTGKSDKRRRSRSREKGSDSS